MGNSRYTRTESESVFNADWYADKEEACLLVAYAPPGSVTVDRCRLGASFTVGRSRSCDISTSDKKASKIHFRIRREADDYWIEDLESTNGTFVRGRRLQGQMKLSDRELIRMGQIIFVFHLDGREFFDPTPMERFGLAGEFHTGPLIREIHAASLSARHLLLGGPSGSGKELVSRALAQVLGQGQQNYPFVAHNAAAFTSEEEATSKLFGVGRRVFSNVDSRAGLIEKANGGILFIDEIHNLPFRVQRSLLRIIEDGKFSRIGETKERVADVRFVFASNEPGPEYGLVHDLIARLRVTPVPPIRERMADIPSIFNVLFEKALERLNQDFSPVQMLRAEHYEAMCLDGFKKHNVRGINDVADKIATLLAAGIETRKAVAQVFKQRFPESALFKGYRTISEDLDDSSRTTPADKTRSSHYEMNKGVIIAAFHKCDGNLAKTERLLEKEGIHTSRRWLTAYIDIWGLPRKKKPRSKE